MMASIFNHTKVTVTLLVILLSWYVVCISAGETGANVVTPELTIMQEVDNGEMSTTITLSWQNLDEIDDDISAVLVGENPGGGNCIPDILVSDEEESDRVYTFPAYVTGSLSQDHMYCIMFQNSDGCLSELVTVQPFLAEATRVPSTTTVTEANTPSTTAIGTPTPNNTAATTNAVTNTIAPTVDTVSEMSTIDTTNAAASDTNTDIAGSEIPTTNTTSESPMDTLNSSSEVFPLPTESVDESGFPEYAIIVIGVVVVLTMINLIAIVLSVLVYVYRGGKRGKEGKKHRSTVITNTEYQSSDLTSGATSNGDYSLLPRNTTLIQPTDPYSKLQQPGSHGNKGITLNGRYSHVENSDPNDKYSKLQQTGANLRHKGIPLDEEYSQLRNPQPGHSDRLQQPGFHGNKVRTPLLGGREYMNSWLKTPSSDEHIRLQLPDLELQHLDTPRNKNTHIYTYIDLGDENDHPSPSSSPPTASSLHHYYSEPLSITDRTD